MCDELGVDVENVRRGIGSAFIYPGCGYGGSCFPKDVRSMINMAGQAGLQDTIFEAVERRNQRQQLVLVDKVVAQFGSDLSGKTFALWGLAFKPGTDDIRGALAITTARHLCDRGASVVACDPQAINMSKQALQGLNVQYTEDPYQATKKADALIVVTEWRQFKQPDFRRLSSQLQSKTIFDGRNLYNPERCVDCSLNYIGIGRSSVAIN